ncbi:hypothetical protein NLU13_7427 [Sarocladium strictum]|uniref:SET domain-containing protein n=1 Tax=Sarocladium strictum TaxID=5046 RepID=A0AA39L5I7_SARSR|nr:hypothetical protein NLU13_7427 [Sarocladium strictum]
MAGASHSIAAFPAWARLNGIDINDLALEDLPGKGFGFVARKQLYEPEDANSIEGSGKSYVSVPRDLILSAEAVGDYAKVDHNFHQLLQTTTPQSTREKVVLYLFTHLVAKKRDSTAGIASTAWTEYIKLLPTDIPVPTLWPEADRSLLQGTSLEVAVKAKLASLEAEFEKLQKDTASMSFWNERWWENESASLNDWILADAWYRSRCLELPQAGEAMVPGLDMVNHSRIPLALYQELSNGDVALQLRPGCSLGAGEEITISYGQTKSAAEMLFSYGFIDSSSTTRELTLSIDPMSDDPLGQAKIHAYGKPPTVKIALKNGTAVWESAFMHLMCLNEEDGLDFRVLQDQDGDRHLRVFWQDQDVTERADNFSELTQGHPLEHVFRLRIVALLEQLVDSQLERIRLLSPSVDNRTDDPARPGSAHRHFESANILRAIETEVLESAAVALETEKTILLQDDSVLEYLGQMEDYQNEQAASASTNEEPDFS